MAFPFPEATAGVIRRDEWMRQKLYQGKYKHKAAAGIRKIRVFLDGKTYLGA